MAKTKRDKALDAWLHTDWKGCVPRTEGEYKKLVNDLDKLIDEVGENEKHPLVPLMKVLGALIEEYEDRYVAKLEGGDS